MSLIVLILIIGATIVCFETTRRGAFGNYPWVGYLIIFVIWALVLLNYIGGISHINLGRVG